MKSKIEVGNLLRQLRGKKKIIEVCETLNISPSALSMYEAGERMPRDEIKVKLAQYYGMSIQSLFFD